MSETTEYLIDGCNLIHGSFLQRMGSRASFDHARMSLIDILRRYRCKHPHIRFTLVFDGTSAALREFRGRGISIFFSGETTADDMIRRILEGRRDAAGTIVVSDDREVRASARVLGGQWCAAAAFLDLVYPLPAKQTRSALPKSLDYSKTRDIEDELRSFYGSRKKKGP